MPTAARSGDRRATPKNAPRSASPTWRRSGVGHPPAGVGQRSSGADPPAAETRSAFDVRGGAVSVKVVSAVDPPNGHGEGAAGSGPCVGSKVPTSSNRPHRACPSPSTASGSTSSQRQCTSAGPPHDGGALSPIDPKQATAGRPFHWSTRAVPVSTSAPAGGSGYVGTGRTVEGGAVTGSTPPIGRAGHDQREEARPDRHRPPPRRHRRTLPRPARWVGSDRAGQAGRPPPTSGDPIWPDFGSSTA